jgi:hypothetical protein
MLIYAGYKSKGKQKLAPKHVREEYEAWCKKHGIVVGKKLVEVKIKHAPGTVVTPFRRETKAIPSLDTGSTGAVTTNCGKNVYTGDKILGIASMHKSNLVPIFNDTAAKDVASMRR